MKLKEYNIKNIKNEKNKAGIYYYYDKDKNKIYTGVSKNIQHRLQASIYGRSDYANTLGKKTLRKKIKYYTVKYTNIKKSRKIEKENKKNCKYNRR